MYQKNYHHPQDAARRLTVDGRTVRYECYGSAKYSKEVLEVTVADPQEVIRLAENGWTPAHGGMGQGGRFVFWGEL